MQFNVIIVSGSLSGLASSELLEARMREYVKMLNRTASAATPPPMMHGRQDSASPRSSTPPLDGGGLSALEIQSRLTLWNLYNNNPLYTGVPQQTPLSPQTSHSPPPQSSPEPQREALDLGLRYINI